jgi:hypothetical protein
VYVIPYSFHPYFTPVLTAVGNIIPALICEVKHSAASSRNLKIHHGDTDAQSPSFFILSPGELPEGFPAKHG